MLAVMDTKETGFCAGISKTFVKKTVCGCYYSSLHVHRAVELGRTKMKQRAFCLYEYFGTARLRWKTSRDPAQYNK